MKLKRAIKITLYIYNKMAYLYRHIRLDKNEPFYIGIGSDDEGKYIRSKTKYKRSHSWKHITHHTEYRIDILLEKIKNAANLKKIRIYCPELNMIFNSLTEAGKILKKSSGNISNILKSKTNKTRSGLTLIKI